MNMNNVMTLVKRNLKVFFRDRMAVAFSLIGVFMVLMLYILFLGDMLTEDSPFSNASEMADSWIMAGVLAITPITTSMGAFGIWVSDKTSGMSHVLSTAPVKNSEITLGYVLSTFIVAVFMSIICLIGTEAYIALNGGSVMALDNILIVLGVLLLGALSSVAAIFLIVSFVKSSNAFAAGSTIIGTMVGFIAGVYMPISQLPEAMQFIVKIFPPSHVASLMRTEYMEAPMGIAFAGASATDIFNYEISMGLTYQFGSTTVEPWMSVVYLVLCSVALLALSIWNVSRQNNA